MPRWNDRSTLPAAGPDATQGEVDAGTDADRAVTPATLANWVHCGQKYEATIGDGVSTSYDVSHGFGSQNVAVVVRETAAPYREVDVGVTFATTNKVTIEFAGAPALNAYTVTVLHQG